MLGFTMFSFGYLWITAAAAKDRVPVLSAKKNESVSLNCTAQREPSVDYYAVTWYKVGPASSLTGLVSRTSSSGRLRHYVGADARIDLELTTLNLVLPPVTCSNAGVYQCYMTAPVGKQCREGLIRLSITDCPTEAPVIPEKRVEVLVEKTPVEAEASPKDDYLLISVAVAVLFSAVFIFIASYRRLKWTKSKTPEKAPYPDPNCPPEKLDLLWIPTLGAPPTKARITAA